MENGEKMINNKLEKALQLLNDLQGVKASDHFLQTTLERINTVDDPGQKLRLVTGKTWLLAAVFSALVFLNIYAVINYNSVNEPAGNTGDLEGENFLAYETISANYYKLLSEQSDEQ